MATVSVAELIAFARAKPGALRYASGGNGSAAHLAMEYFKLRTRTDIGHVPYKGTGPAVADVMGGQVEVMMTGVPAVLQQVRAGRLRALQADVERLSRWNDPQGVYAHCLCGEE